MNVNVGMRTEVDLNESEIDLNESARDRSKRMWTCTFSNRTWIYLRLIQVGSIKVKNDLNVNVGMRTEIDLNESEIDLNESKIDLNERKHFLKANHGLND